MSDDADYLRNLAIPFGKHQRAGIEAIADRIEDRESKLDAMTTRAADLEKTKNVYVDDRHEQALEIEALKSRLDALQKEYGLYADAAKNIRASWEASEKENDELRSRLGEQAKRSGEMFDLLTDVATKERKDALGFVTVSLRMRSEWWRQVDEIVFGSKIEHPPAAVETPAIIGVDLASGPDRHVERHHPSCECNDCYAQKYLQR